MAGKYTDPLRECPICGDIWAGTFGHSPAGSNADTDRHKAAIAAAERKAK